MVSIRGELFCLKAHGHETDAAASPLLQVIDRDRGETKIVHRNKHGFPRLDNFKSSKFSHIQLGKLDSDWKRLGFELTASSCELIYHVEQQKLDTNSPRTVLIGFITRETEVKAGPTIETVDFDVQTLDRLRLFTLEICFRSDEYFFPKYCILAHADEDERNRWLKGIQGVIDAKTRLFYGWDDYKQKIRLNPNQKAEDWIKLRGGEAQSHVNLKAARTARLHNGKVMLDVPIVFRRLGELHSLDDDDDDRAPPVFGLRLGKVLPALSELGLDLGPRAARRLMEELQRSAGNRGYLLLDAFRLVVQSCRQEMLLPPSEDMKHALRRVVWESRNPFLSLLTDHERAHLVEGRDAAGHNVCVCRHYAKDAVLVRQGDAGDSMFLVLEGSLSVVVSFGSGAATLQKEVAELTAGAVLGEMSLVLGKPRSATCLVKSDAAAVAEIARDGVEGLLAARPGLAWQLESMVARREAANLLTANRNAAAGHRGAAEGAVQLMLQYRQRGEQSADDGAHPAAGGGGGSSGGGGGGGGTGPWRDGRASSEARGSLPALRGGRRSTTGGNDGAPRRVVSRRGHQLRRSTSSDGGGVGAGVGGGGGGGGSPEAERDRLARVSKTGRWVRCRGAAVFVVD